MNYNLQPWGVCWGERIWSSKEGNTLFYNLYLVFDYLLMCFKHHFAPDSIFYNKVDEEEEKKLVLGHSIYYSFFFAVV